MANADVRNPNEGSLPARIAAWPAKVKEYFEDLQGEMKRVTWPSWKQVRATTGVVIVAVFAFAAYFAVVDLVMNKSIGRVYDTFTK